VCVCCACRYVESEFVRACVCPDVGEYVFMRLPAALVCLLHTQLIASNNDWLTTNTHDSNAEHDAPIALLTITDGSVRGKSC